MNFLSRWTKYLLSEAGENEKAAIDISMMSGLSLTTTRELIQKFGRDRSKEAIRKLVSFA